MPPSDSYVHIGYELALGAVLLCAVLLIHGLGMVAVRKIHGWLAASLPGTPLAHRPAFSFVILVMLVVHTSEMFLWAIALFANGAISPLRQAMYYVAVTYTTLGYEEALLSLGWRGVAPLIAMSGLFAFGWTTSTLFALVTQRADEPPQHR